MRTGKIYKITNVITKKIYIGQTIIDTNTRLSQHFQKSEQGRKSKLYVAMREYPKENFIIEIIEENIPINQLGEKEIYYIKKYDAVKKGYNMVETDNGRTHYANIDVETVLNMVDQDITNVKIAEYFNVNVATIQRLLSSMRINRYNKVDDEELKKLWNVCLNEDLAKYYNVDEKTIRRHAKKIGLPNKPKHPDYKNLKRLSKSNKFI